MRTLLVLRAATMVLSLGIGSAYAGDGDGAIADTRFTGQAGGTTGRRSCLSCSPQQGHVGRAADEARHTAYPAHAPSRGIARGHDAKYGNRVGKASQSLAPDILKTDMPLGQLLTDELLPSRGLLLSEFSR